MYMRKDSSSMQIERKIRRLEQMSGDNPPAECSDEFSDKLTTFAWDPLGDYLVTGGKFLSLWNAEKKIKCFTT